jgi:hypothetical protein
MINSSVLKMGSTNFLRNFGIHLTDHLVS